jgi:hypothetical protein
VADRRPPAEQTTAGRPPERRRRSVGLSPTRPGRRPAGSPAAAWWASGRPAAPPGAVPPAGPAAGWCGRSAERAGPTGRTGEGWGWVARSGRRGRDHRGRVRRRTAPAGPAFVQVRRVKTTAKGRVPTNSARTAVALDVGPRSGGPDRRWKPSVSSPDIRPPGVSWGTELVWSGWRRSAPTPGCPDKAFPRVSAEPSRTAEPAMLRVPQRVDAPDRPLRLGPSRASSRPAPHPLSTVPAQHCARSARCPGPPNPVDHGIRVGVAQQHAVQPVHERHDQQGRSPDDQHSWGPDDQPVRGRRIERPDGGRERGGGRVPHNGQR